jgi:hypothetical protein
MSTELLSDSDRYLIARALLPPGPKVHRFLDELAADRKAEQAAHQAHLDDLNAQLRADAAGRRAKWLPDFEARVARHEPISREDVEDYGRVPAGYVRADALGDVWGWVV